MAQGTRGRLVRGATLGLGVLLCTSLVGCMNTDKDKKDKLAKQPTPGLPGTPTIGANGQAAAKTGQPGSQFGTNNGIQQTGGVQPRVGSSGINTNTGTGQPSYQNYPVQPGVPSTIGTPGPQGLVPSPLPNNVDPRLGGQNTNPVLPGNPVAGVGPGLSSGFDPLPPPPPDRVTSGSNFAVQPPNAFTPIAPPPAPPVKEQALSTGYFGNK